MATVIDSLLVELGLDTKGFETGRDKVNEGLKNTSEEAKKRARETEDSAKQMAMMFAKLRGEVVGLFLAFAGAKSITQFVTNTINQTAAVGRASQLFGQGANSINAWGDAIQGAGGDAKEAMAIFGKIKDIQADFIRHPENLNMPLMGQLGIHSRGEFDNPEELMLHLADQFQSEMGKAKTPEDQSRVQATFRQRVKEFLGLSDEAILMLEKGRPALEKELALYRERDRVTQSDVEGAQEFNKELAHLEKAFTGLARGPLTTSMGILADILDLVAGNTDHMGEKLRVFMLGLWGLAHPLDSLVAILADAGIISRDTANTYFKNFGDTPPDALLGAGGGGSGPREGDDRYDSSTDLLHGPIWTGGGFGARPGAATRADRNNNPGNIEDGHFARSQPGYAGGDGRFARFSSPEAGAAAQTRLIQGYIAGGRNTIASIVAKYAPGHENNTGAYIAAVSRATGIAANQRLSQADAVVVAHAMSRHEGYHGRFLPTLGRYATPAEAARAAAGGRGGGNTHINVHVDARGAQNPQAVADKTGSAVRRAQEGRTRVANVLGGVG